MTPPISIVLFVVASLLGAVGQWLYRTGATSGSLINMRIALGIVCYIGVLIAFVAAYKRGGEMHVLYPIYASTFIFAALLSYWLIGTPIKPVHVAGMALLVVGMFLMGR